MEFKRDIKKFNILIISSGFWPEISPRSFRATELAKEFALQGNDVTVITHKNKDIHDKFESENGVKIIDFGKLKLKKPNLGSGKIGYWINRIISRALSLFFEYPNIQLTYLLKKLLKKHDGYDILISIAVPYPIHWGVAWSRSEKHRIAKIWVADCGDPYMGCDTDSFKKPFYFKYVEKWFMRKTDFISIPVEKAKHGYYKEFHKKIKIIPQGFKIKERQRAKGLRKNNNVPVFGYAGSFIPNKRDPRPFLEYLSTLNKDFKFVIHTTQEDLIRKYKNILGNKLEINSIINREELIEQYSSYDFLVYIDNDSSFAVPSKIIDYAIIKRPVLNITKTVDYEIINEFINGNYSKAMKLPSLEEFKIENVCDKFTNLALERVNEI